MELACPSCKSDNTQRLAVIYEGGLSDINTKSKGTAIGFGRGGIGVGVGGSKTTGTSQTAASQRAAPPQKKTLPETATGDFWGLRAINAVRGHQKQFCRWSVKHRLACRLCWVGLLRISIQLQDVATT